MSSSRAHRSRRDDPVGIAYALGAPLPELVAPVCARRRPKVVGVPTKIV